MPWPSFSDEAGSPSLLCLRAPAREKKWAAAVIIQKADGREKQPSAPTRNADPRAILGPRCATLGKSLSLSGLGFIFGEGTHNRCRVSLPGGGEGPQVGVWVSPGPSSQASSSMPPPTLTDVGLMLGKGGAGGGKEQKPRASRFLSPRSLIIALAY